MAEGAWIIIGVTVCVVAVLIFFCWIIDRGVQVELGEPYGDASDTPNVNRALRKEIREDRKKRRQAA